MVVFLRAEFSRERKDSFLWEFCLSKADREAEKVREGAERRTWVVTEGLGCRVRSGARLRWRAQDEAMATASATAGQGIEADYASSLSVTPCSTTLADILAGADDGGGAREKHTRRDGPMTYPGRLLARRRSSWGSCRGGRATGQTCEGHYLEPLRDALHENESSAPEHILEANYSLRPVTLEHGAFEGKVELMRPAT